MKTFFYVIEWHDGSGKTSGLKHASSAEDAFQEAVDDTISKTGHGGHPSIPYTVGDVITFNQVDGSHD